MDWPVQSRVASISPSKVASRQLSQSNSSRPWMSLNWPRTQVTIMWSARNSAAVWPGSKIQVAIRYPADSCVVNCLADRLRVVWMPGCPKVDTESMPFISRGFRGRHREENERLPPGQYLVRDWPVLSAGPTPHTPLDRWSFSLEGAVDPAKTWTWEEFRSLPGETVTRDVHCVTKWSKLDMVWEGVSVDTLLEGAQLQGGYVTAFCDGGHTTTLEAGGVPGGREGGPCGAGGEPLAPEHGGPARLLVPHLYFWK